MKDKNTALNLLLMISSLSLVLISCNNKKYRWQPGISAPKYYPVGECSVDFKSAGNGSHMPFDAGWGWAYGSVVSGNDYKEIPDSISINYNSSAENFTYQGKFPTQYKKLDSLFQKYDSKKHTINLVAGMAPGGWIRVWFQTWDRETEKQVSVEVAKAKL